MTRVIQKLSLPELQIVSQLRNAGIPLDGEVVGELTPAGRSFSITQVGTVVENEVFDLDDGGTGFLIKLMISCDADRSVSIHHVRPEIPWYEPTFRWLPKLTRRSYCFPRGGPQDFAPEVVLNPRIGPLDKFYPRDWVEGFLLGIGDEPIPESYVDRQGIAITLSICVSRGWVIPVNITLCCRRSRRVSQRRVARSTPREPLFDSTEITEV